MPFILIRRLAKKTRNTKQRVSAHLHREFLFLSIVSRCIVIFLVLFCRQWRIDNNINNVADSRFQKLSRMQPDIARAWPDIATLWDSLHGDGRTRNAASRQLNEQIYRRIQSSVYSHGIWRKHVCYAELPTLQLTTQHPVWLCFCCWRLSDRTIWLESDWSSASQGSGLDTARSASELRG